MVGPLYALGAFGASLLVQTLTLWLFPFYVASGPVRLSPEHTGLALALGRLANSAGDLVVAAWSDSLTSPRGRRRPFLILGSPLLAGCFVLVWTPPAAATAAYLAAALAGFFFLFAAVINPYLALMADQELTPGQRVSAAAWQAAGNLFGTATAYVTSGLLHARFGYPAMAAAFGGVSVVCLWAAAASVRAEPVRQGTRTFREAVAALSRSPALRAYLAGLSLAWVGLSMVSLVLVFLVTVLMGLPAESVPAVLSAALASTALFLPLVARWGRRTGPQRALEACLWVAAAFLPAVSLVGRLPVDARVAGYGLVAVSGLPLAALYVLPNAILAQMASRHDLQALHFGLQGLVLNVANASAAAAVGLLLRWGYAAGSELGLRLVPACAAALVVAGLLAFRRLRYS